MKCETCGCNKMEVLEINKQWLCNNCGSLWTKHKCNCKEFTE